MGRQLAPAEHRHGGPAQGAGPLHRGDDDSAAAVGAQAAVAAVQGRADDGRIQHILDRHRAAPGRLGVEGRPLAGGHGDLRQLLAGGAVTSHVALRHQGVVAEGRHDAIGRLEQALRAAQVVGRRRDRPLLAVGAEGGAVADQGDVAEARHDRRRCVPHVAHVGGTTDGGRVVVAGVGAQVLPHQQAGHDVAPLGKDTVHVLESETGLAQGLPRRLRDEG